MVEEFPDLQGIMGFYYAKNDQEKGNIPLAIRDHYKPRYAGDELPETLEGCAVALADKLDTIVGIFGINQAPTGERDPYGLRRAALGVLRIIIEKQLPLDLKTLLEHTIKQYQVPLINKETQQQALAFMMERLKRFYTDKGISSDIFAAVFARYPTKPYDFHRRIHAVKHFISLPQAKALAAANKRVSNLLKKQTEVESDQTINGKLLQDDAEKGLNDAMHAQHKAITLHYQKAEYTEALTLLADLQAPVDRFFDEVMVMTDDESLRRNRIALLSALRALFLEVADVSLLQNDTKG